MDEEPVAKKPRISVGEMTDDTTDDGLNTEEIRAPYTTEEMDEPEKAALLPKIPKKSPVSIGKNPENGKYVLPNYSKDESLNARKFFEILRSS